MKIGIITFHWATNYGAILQAYALQTYLSLLGHEVYIINYKPSKYTLSFLKCFRTFRISKLLANLTDYRKEKELEKFRRKYLHTTRVYNSQEDLINYPPDLEAYVTGSDQVWNPYFTTIGEGRNSTAYFLDFGRDDIVRLGYAVSFGCNEYPDKAALIAREQIEKFKAISVRENSGSKIIETLGGDLLNPVLECSMTMIITTFLRSKKAIKGKFFYFQLS